ncbi:chlororespiratory reduction protein 7 [Cyanobium sp. CH-040]|uniref:chlororespiratory reduction protein 7 n=1 Tax=Cyanobium sp. CH-040 TaxID=2823708 RepID=UPI0020CE7CD3|nr:chlororespiratory reduction protein 7 [Cyanobium sp. CH-040]MCP9928994.1 chlororespiratory reduction protein 7 [Cyanobium sp. CH-040]
MSDPLIRELDHYVVLEPAGGERILTAAETLGWLEHHLSVMAEVPADLSGLPSRADQAARLLETACQLELEPGRSVQWFAVRLEPPGQA